MENPNYKKLIRVLEDIFQLNQADLDFGIYRIMNHKRTEIIQFLEKDLIPQVKAILADNLTGDKTDLQKQLDDTIQQLKSLGVDPNSADKVKELRQQLERGADLEAEENTVFNRLANFFSRYYEGGDFISLRRYKEGVYAIPYEGEEVKLHWANHDQYYIKTSEYLKNYNFKISNGKSVSFVLFEANTEQNNNKAAKGMERRFALQAEEPLKVVGQELQIYFTYEPTEKKKKQSDLLKAAFERIKTQIPADFLEVLISNASTQTEKNKKRTLLEKHFKNYAARNTFDYFIHKNLGKFLRTELDFYIKNEVLHLDDINTRDTNHFVRQLSQVRALKEIGQKIIAFLEQLENFQKKLWLKKKFVVETQYCITLDRVPENLYPDIINNTAQIDEWKKLFYIQDITAPEPASQTKLFADNEVQAVAYSEPLTLDFLKANPFLVLDTRFFSEYFKDSLIASIDNLDEQLDGILINSENFQALNLLQERYREQVKCVYIDPPYNTGKDGFAYKDSFQHSSWVSFLENRYSLALGLVKSEGAIFTSIDDREHKNLVSIQEVIFGSGNFVSNIIWQKKYSPSNDAKWFSDNHDFITCFSKDKDVWRPYLLPRTEKQNKRYKNPDNDPRKEWKPGGIDVKTYSSAYDYPITTPSGRIVNPPKGSCWRYSKDKFQDLIDDNRIWFGEEGNNVPSIKRFLTEVKNGITSLTIWKYEEVGHTQEATQELKNIGFPDFSSPKPSRLIEKVGTVSLEKDSIILDYFAGSGTTGNATINLNRVDKGSRKYILVEMGEYFDSVTKPRIQKVIYSKDWKNGRPISREGSSHCFKYLRLESYEDALNNLTMKQSNTQQLILDNNADFREGYMLHYLLDTATKESLLDLAAFENPFDYHLNITRHNETQATKVDLVETFNYLIGIVVERMSTIRGFRVVEGHNLQGEQLLVIWRNVSEKSNQDLDVFFQKMGYNTRDREFDRIYVNGDNNLENLKTEADRWKVVLIEEAFKELMFQVADV